MSIIGNLKEARWSLKKFYSLHSNGRKYFLGGLGKVRRLALLS